MNPKKELLWGLWVVSDQAVHNQQTNSAESCPGVVFRTRSRLHVRTSSLGTLSVSLDEGCIGGNFARRTWGSVP